MKMMLLSFWGVTVQTRAHTELGTEGRGTCMIKNCYICHGRNEKKIKTNLKYIPPQIFKYFYSPAFLSFVLHWVFIFTTSAPHLLFAGGGLPLSLSSLFQVFFLSLHPIFPFFPIHQIRMPSSFHHDVELKVVTRSSCSEQQDPSRSRKQYRESGRPAFHSVAQMVGPLLKAGMSTEGRSGG